MHGCSDPGHADLPQARPPRSAAVKRPAAHALTLSSFVCTNDRFLAGFLLCMRPSSEMARVDLRPNDLLSVIPLRRDAHRDVLLR